MAITDDRHRCTPTIDGIELTPKVVGLDGPPTFDTVEEERLHRKQQLAGALRMFGRFGFGEGVAGHITVRDPEFPDHFWVNPFGMSFRHMRSSDLILVNHQGDVVYGTKPVNRAAFVLHAAIHAARPDVIAAAHSHSPYGKAFSSLGIPLAPITQDACIFYEDHTRHLRAGRRGRVRGRGRQGVRRRVPDRQGRDPPEPRPVHRRRDGRRGGVLVHLDGALVPGAAAGDGRRQTRSEIRARVRRVHRASRPATRSPAGSASSRCGRRSAAPNPNCSTEHARQRAAPPARSVRSSTALARGAVRPLGGRRSTSARSIAVLAVRRGRTADRRLVPGDRRDDRPARGVAAAPSARVDPRRARRRGGVRHRHRR